MNKRAKIALNIGEIKTKCGFALYSPERECEILRKIVKENQGPLGNEAVKRIFRLIIKETRELEKEVKNNGGSNET